MQPFSDLVPRKSPRGLEIVWQWSTRRSRLNHTLGENPDLRPCKERSFHRPLKKSRKRIVKPDRRGKDNNLTTDHSEASRSARCPPTNPVPPVMAIFIVL